MGQGLDFTLGVACAHDGKMRCVLNWQAHGNVSSRCLIIGVYCN